MGAEADLADRMPDPAASWSFTETPRFRAALANPAVLPLSPAIQPKLAIGAVDDPLEREADAVAERVMRAPGSALGSNVAPSGGRPCVQCGGSRAEGSASGRCDACQTRDSQPIVRRNAGGAAGSSPAPPSVDAALAEPGRALPPQTRGFFEQRLGASLDHVRVHDGLAAQRSADEIGALAYSVGNHIVFSADRFQPGTPAGDRLIAHEIVHTLQAAPRAHRTVRRQAAPPTPGPECPANAPRDLNRHRGGHLNPPLRIGREQWVYAIWEVWREHDSAAAWLSRAIQLWAPYRYGREPPERQAAVIAYLRGRVASLGVRGADESLAHPGCAYAFGIDQETLDGTRRISGELTHVTDPPAEHAPPPGPRFQSEIEAEPSATPGVYVMPALAADIDGFEVQPIGATGVYTMNVHWGDAAGGLLGQVAAVRAGAHYTWEVWDISGAPSVQEAERTVRRRMGLDSRADPTARIATRGAGASRDLQRAGRDLSERPGQIDRDQRAAVQEGRWADAVGDEINRQLIDLGVVTRYGRELLGGAADLTGDDRSRRIPFTGAGVFVVRCVARMPGEPDHRRAPSVATKVVVTRSAEVASQRALAAPSQAAQESRDTASVLEQLPGSDPVEIARLRAEAADRERQASGSPLSIIEAELAKTEADLARISGASVLIRAGLHDPAVTELESRRDTLRNRRTTLLGRESEMGAGGAAVRRVRAALVSRVTGQTYQLLLEAAEPTLVGGRWRCALSDVTTQDAHAYEGFAPDTGDAAADKLAATRNALVALAEEGDYGGGSLSYVLPEAPWLAGRSEAQRTATLATREEGARRGTHGARDRLTEVGAALAVLGIVASGGTVGVAAGLLGAGLAADNIARRWREGTLHADAQLVGDLLNVLGAVAIGARVIGELAVVERAGGGVILRAARAVGGVAVAGADVADTVSNVGGVIMANAQFVNDMLEISEQESQGLSPSEARRRRISTIAGALHNNALVIAGHMREGASAHDNPENARAAGEPPPPNREQTPTREHETPPASGREAPPHDGALPSRESPRAREQTMAGPITGAAPPTEQPTAPRSPGAAAHDQWTADTAAGGLGKRPPPLPNRSGARVAPGETHYGLTSMSEALGVYDDFRSRAPGREVGIYRSEATGEYAVVAGREGSVGRPSRGVEGEWGNVLHNHPDPDQSLTLRNPAPNDVHLQWQEAARRGEPVTAFIEHDVPGGGRAYTAVTVAPPPSNHITIRFQNAEGVTVTRKFANLSEYSDDWGSRTRYVTPGSSSYLDHVRDLDDHARNRERNSASGPGPRPGGETPSPNADGPPTVRPPAGPATADPAAAASSGAGGAAAPSSVRETGFGGWRATWANDPRALVAFEPNGSGGVSVGDIMRGGQPSGSAGQMLADTLRAAGQGRPTSIRMSGIINEPTLTALGAGTAPGDTLLGRTTAAAARNLGGHITGWTTGVSRGKTFIEARIEY